MCFLLSAHIPSRCETSVGFEATRKCERECPSICVSLVIKQGPVGGCFPVSHPKHAGIGFRSPWPWTDVHCCKQQTAIAFVDRKCSFELKTWPILVTKGALVRNKTCFTLQGRHTWGKSITSSTDPGVGLLASSLLQQRDHQRVYALSAGHAVTGSPSLIAGPLTALRALWFPCQAPGHSRPIYYPVASQAASTQRH